MMHRRKASAKCVNRKANPATQPHGPNHNNQRLSGRNSFPAILHPSQPAAIDQSDRVTLRALELFFAGHSPSDAVKYAGVKTA